MNLPHIVSTHCIQELIQMALKEDIGPGDVTSESLIEEKDTARARIISKGHYVLAGGAVAESVFHNVDAGLKTTLHVEDGLKISPDDGILSVTGSARSILAGERTALNFLQRLTGIATLTSQFVDKAKAHGVQILDTRKTTPGMRILEKYAVRRGGGRNHRMGLYDRILIKDNHLSFWKSAKKRSYQQAIEQAREKYPGLLIEVEVQTPEELESVLHAKPDWVLLDNMPLDVLRECARRCKGRCRIEASGGITLETIEPLLTSGIDAVSVGALTHSVRAADLSLEFVS